MHALFSFCRPVFYFPLGCACSVLHLVVFVVFCFIFSLLHSFGVFLYMHIVVFFMVIRFVRSCMHVLFASTVCPPKKYNYNNRIISIEGTFFWDTLYIYCRCHSGFGPPSRFGPPGPNLLVDMDPPVQIS